MSQYCERCYKDATVHLCDKHFEEEGDIAYDQGVTEERERCARIAERETNTDDAPTIKVGEMIADAIRNQEAE